MKLRRLALLSVWVLSAAALAAGTLGVSSVSADRAIHVDVAEEGRGYLEVEQTAYRNRGTVNLTVAVTNRFPFETTLRQVSVAAPEQRSTATSVGPGERVTVTLRDISCHDAIRVTASAAGLRTRLTRKVDCGEPVVVHENRDTDSTETSADGNVSSADAANGDAREGN